VTADHYDRIAAASGKHVNGAASFKTACPCCSPGNGRGDEPLSVSRMSDGGALVKCHRGCAQAAVWSAVCDSAGIEARGPRAEPIRHAYQDAEGNVIAVKLRRPKHDRRASDKAKCWWDRKLGGIELPLYGLPDLLDALARGQRVWLFEGEGKRDAVARLGLAATSVPHGAGDSKTRSRKFTADHERTLAGADVVVVADPDDEGRAFANHVAERLKRTGATVRVLEIPQLDGSRAPKGWDAEDFVIAGGTREQLEAFAASTRPGTLLAIEAAPPPPRAQADAIDAPVVRWASDIKPEPVNFVDRAGLFPLCCLSLLVAPGGTGKTLIAIDLAAKLSRGAPWPCGTGTMEPLSSLIWTSEDSASMLVVPRLAAASAAMDRVAVAESMTPLNLEWLAGVVRERDIRVVILDPLTDAIACRDGDNEADVRGGLVPLLQCARDLGLAVIGVRHTRKATAASGADRVLGSVAWNAAARSVVAVAQHEGGLVVARVKGNLSAQPKPLSCVIESSGGAPYIRWNGEADLDREQVDDLMSGRTAEREAGQTRERPELDRAVEALRVLLGDGAWHLQGDVEYALENTYHVTRATSRRAREFLRVHGAREGDEDGPPLSNPEKPGRSRPGYWRLPSVFDQAVGR